MPSYLQNVAPLPKGNNMIMSKQNSLSLYEKTIYLSLVLLPINCFHFGEINEMLFELGFYPYLILFPIMALLTLQRFYLSTFTTKLLGVFLYWVIISGVANFYSIFHSYDFSTSGSSRYVKQIIEIVIGLFIVIFITTVIAKNKITIAKLSNYVILSIKICVVVGIIEILGKILGIGLFLTVYKAIFHLVNRNSFIPERIHSLSGEPSWYGIFAAFAFPFLLHSILTTNKNKIWLILFLTTIYFTDSRTMYCIILLQTIIYLPLFRKSLLNKKFISIALIACSLIIGVFAYNPTKIESSIGNITSTIMSLNDFSLKSNESYSTMSRLGMQITALKMGSAHMVFGVGEGQFIFHFREYVPTWATKAFEIKDAVDGKKWPQVHGMYTRIYAELGLIGLLIWLSIWFSNVIKLLVLRKKLKDPETKKETSLLLCLIVGVFLCGFNVDSFRMMVMWIALGVISGWFYLNNPEHKKSLTKIQNQLNKH